MSEVMEEGIMDEPITDVGVDAGAVEAAEPSGVGEAAVQESAPESATPAWAPTQEGWEALQGQINQLSQYLTPAPEVPQAPQYLQEDPTTGEYGIDPQQLEAFIQFKINEGVNSRLSPVEPILSQTVADRGEQVINQKFEELKQEMGSFDVSVAREIAEGLAARPGADPLRALREGAQRAAALEKSISDRAIEQYRQTLGNIGNAKAEGAASSAAVSAYELPRDNKGKIDYGAAASNWLARNGYES